MSLYLFKPITTTAFECTKCDDDMMPLATYNMSIDMRGGKKKMFCACPAGKYRNSCKHATYLSMWRKLPSPIGWGYDDKEKKFVQVFEASEALTKLLEQANEEG